MAVGKRWNRAWILAETGKNLVLCSVVEARSVQGPICPFDKGRAQQMLRFLAFPILISK